MKETENKKPIEKALELSEKKFKAVAETAQDCIIIINGNSHINFVNSQVFEIFGYTPQELVGEHLHRLMPANYHEAHLKGIERFLNTGQTHIIGSTIEVEGRKKDGTIFPIELSLSYFKENDDYFFTGIIRDITRRKKEIQALKESEEKFRVLAQNSTDVISVHKADSTILFMSSACEKVLGYKPEELSGKLAYDYYHPDDLTKMHQAYDAVWGSNETYTVVFRFRKKDEKYVWFESAGKTIRNDKNEPFEIYASNRDITKRKETEELLKRTEERFRLVVESIRDYAIFMLDSGGHIITWNEGAKRLKGYSREEILGKHFSIFYPKEEQAKNYFESRLRKAKENGRYTEEGWRIRKDGTRFFANVIITPLYDPITKNHLGFIKITRDLTKQKQADDKLHQLNLELEEKVKQRTHELSGTVSELKKINVDLDNFIYTASHDLKAPITNLEGLINLLKDSIPANASGMEELLSQINFMASSVARLKSTILDLTEIVKIQKESQEEANKLDCREIIQEVRTDIDSMIREADAVIQIEVKKCPPIYFSKKNLRSVIYNLLNNAIKYRSPDRKPEILICIQEEDNGYLLLSVKDNGLGIDLEKHGDKMFSMFKRFHSHTEGSGIGLYLVKRMMDNAGGKIEVESEVGKGTVFKLFFKIGK